MFSAKLNSDIRKCRAKNRPSVDSQVSTQECVWNTIPDFFWSWGCQVHIQSLSLSCASVAVIVHRYAKHLPHVDFLLCSPHSPAPSHSSWCLLVQPLLVHRWNLVSDTHKYCLPILSALNQEWTPFVKHKFPDIYRSKGGLFLTRGVISALNYSTMTTAASRMAVLNNLHSGDLGLKKMKTLVMLTWL